MDSPLWLQPVTASAAALVARADASAARGDLATARALLRQATELSPDDNETWLKLASLARAAGDPRGALGAVRRALALAPLDFTALLMRASILEHLGDPGVGEAYGQALAQRPAGLLPPQMTEVLARGQARYDEHVSAREAVLIDAMADAEQRGSADEAERIRRFRSNALRKTRVYHSEPTHFHFPGLVEREFHPRSEIPWLARLEEATAVIRSEFDAVASAERAELVPYIQYPAHEALRQWKPLNHSHDWTAIHLWQNGILVEANARHCPRTMALLEEIGQPRIAGASPNAMFSLLGPGVTIPPHVGINNTRLVCHLPLVIPDGCWFRVGAQTRPWRIGEAFVFDDTIEHEAKNPSDQLRVVLILDLWHPGLSPVEREAVTRLLEVETADGGL